MTEPLANDSGASVTQLLSAVGNGDAAATEVLLAIVYQELRSMAHRHMAREREGHTLQTTALVHEAYLRLIDQKATTWQNRSHFYGIAAQMMRRVLVDHARSRGSVKRGGALQRMELDEAMGVTEDRAAQAIALDEALTNLAAFDERKSKVVELKFFGGLAVAEVAEVLGVSVGTVERDWTLAKAWLRREMGRLSDES